MNLVKAIGVGALGLLAVSGLRMIIGKSKQASLPTKEETLLILEEVRREYYPLLIDIADYVAKELAPRGVPPDSNEQLVLENPPFKKQIEQINKKIYHKYSEDQVKQAIESMYKEDGDIIKQRHQFREEYKKSLMGIRPEEQMIISRKLSKVKVLEVVQQLLNCKIERMEDVQFLRMDRQDQQKFLELDVEEDQRTAKETLKTKLGLFATDSIKIFHFAVAQYNQEDEQFRGRYELILSEYNDKIKELVQE